MKKIFTSLCALLMASTMCMAGYTLRVLTFEDGSEASGFEAMAGVDNYVSSWSEMIPAEQYGDPILYGESGMGESEQFYTWYDGGNTELYSELNEGYGSYAYWSGGEAISHYWTENYESYGTYEQQLTAYRPGSNSIETAGGGHNGSNHFCVHFGYADNSGWGLATVSSIKFNDGVARVIDHVWINPTTYTYYCITGGNELTAALGEDGIIWLEARGFASASDEEPTETLTFRLFDGQGTATLDWTKWDLSSLGEIEKLEFSMYGEGEGSENGYGLSQPAYIAWDDMAVRFPSADPDPEPEPTSYSRTGLTAGNFGTICLAYNVNEGDYSGATFYKVAERNATNVVLEEVTSLVAGEAYIFEAIASEISCTYSGEKVNTPATATTANVLQGAFETTTIPSGKWFLKDNKLWCSTGTQTVGANRAYLTGITPAAAAPVPGRRRLNMPIQNMPTAVSNTADTQAKVRKVMIDGKLYIQRDGSIYDMTGSCVK